MARRLLVKSTHAEDAPERANLAWNVAATGLASGLEVAVFLAVEGVHVVRPGVAERIEVPEAPPLSELVQAVYAAGSVTVCTPCALRRGLTEDDFLAGTQFAGSAAFVELATDAETTALVY